MKIVLGIVLVVIAIIAIVLAIGAALPRKHSASRSRLVHQSPANVYAIVRDVANAPQWRSEVTRVEMLEPTRFREHAKYRVVTYDIIDDQPARLLTTRIADKDLGYSGSWTYRFAPENGGTRVTITEDGEVSNVLFRFMSRFVFGYTTNIDKTLAALAAKCDTAPRPSADPSRGQ